MARVLATSASMTVSTPRCRLVDSVANDDRFCSYTLSRALQIGAADGTGMRAVSERFRMGPSETRTRKSITIASSGSMQLGEQL